MTFSGPFQPEFSCDFVLCKMSMNLPSDRADLIFHQALNFFADHPNYSSEYLSKGKYLTEIPN